MKRKTRTIKAEQLLYILKDNSSLTMISEACKKSKSTIHGRLKILEKKGFVFQHNKQWHLTESGIKKAQKKTRTNDPPCAQTRTTKRIMGRSHKQIIFLAHKEDEGLWMRKFQGSMVSCFVPGLNRKVDFQFTIKGVQFQLQKPPMSDVMDHVVGYHDSARKAAVFLERRFKIKLVRPSDLGVRKAYGELAFMATGMAEKEIEAGRRIWLYSWEGDGKPRILFDKSKGSAEWELAGKTLEDDAIETANFLEVLNNGEFRKAFDNARALHAYMPELMQFMKVFAVGMREHMSLIHGLQDVANSMKQAIPMLPKVNPVDVIFANPELLERFNKSSRAEKDRMLGLR